MVTNIQSGDSPAPPPFKSNLKRKLPTTSQFGALNYGSEYYTEKVTYISHNARQFCDPRSDGIAPLKRSVSTSASDQYSQNVIFQLSRS